MDGSGPDEEAVRVLHEEARRHLDASLSVIQELDDKTASLVRFNAVLVGVVVTGMSVGVRSLGSFPGLDGVLVVLALGLVALLISIIEGVRSYLKPAIDVGVDAARLEDALDFDADGTEMRTEVVRTHRISIDQNYLVLEKTAARFRGMLYALVAGLTLLVVGTLTLLVLGVQ